MQGYQVGDQVRLTYAFYTGDTPVLADPDHVTFRVTPPGAAYTWPTDPEVVRDSLGTFHVDWSIDAYGVHDVSWQAYDEDDVSLEATRDEFYAE